MTETGLQFDPQPWLTRALSPRRFDVMGKVTRVLGLVVEGYLPKAPVGAICEIRNEEGDAPRLAEVIGFKDNHVQMMIIGDVAGVRIGSLIRMIQTQARVQVSPQLIGRVIDPTGQPLDGKGPIEGTTDYSLYAAPSPSLSRRRIEQPVTLGVRCIDGLITCGEGQRVCVMAGSGVGKSTLLGMMARNTSGDVNVIALIGERGREVREFVERDLGPEGLARSVVVVATSDAPPLIRIRGAYVATTIAEYFRDRGSKVLLLMDSLTRFAMAMREVGLSIGEPPTSRGYTPSTFSTMPKLLERAGTTDHNGSITGFYTVLTEADDINDPIADCVRSIVDGHITLSRKMANEGNYPAIDVLNSLSRVMTDVIDSDHKMWARKVRALLSGYLEMQDYINIGAYVPGKNPELDEAVKKIQHIRQFLRQNVDEKSSFEDTKKWMSQLAR
jgi:flagellum-specific ATP synthase